MDVLSFVQAEAATKLPKAERLGWARKGLAVIQERGRWKAALTASQVRRAAEQLVEHRAEELAREAQWRASRRPGGPPRPTSRRLTNR